MAEWNSTQYTIPTASMRELDFDQPVVNIGGNPDNDITLPGEDVLPFHAMVVLQDEQYRLVSLAPEAELYLDGDQVESLSTPVSENQRIDIGSYSLFLRRNGTPTSMHVIVTSGGGAAPVPVEMAGDTGEQVILLSVTPAFAEVQVDQPASYTLEIINAGPIVASFSVSVQGVPDEWIEVSPRVVNLNESQRASVNIRVTPPRLPSSTAGKHPISIVVTSPNYPKHRNVAQVELSILPYYDFALGNLSPRQQRIPYRQSSGLTSLPITNQGNSAATFDVTAQDDENGCSFDFRLSDELELHRNASVTVAPGETTVLPITISPLKRMLIALRSHQYHYTVSVNVAEQPATPQVLSGTATSSPLLGWWSILLAVLLAALGLVLLLQPRISYFRAGANKDVIELGDSTSLEWSVSPFATRLNITGVDRTISGRRSRITINPTQSTTYEMTASNWLSSLLGMDRKQSQTILVVPTTPRISVFDVDTTEVNKGEPVLIRWSVATADTAYLTIDDVIYELPPDQFSGTKEVVLEDDAIVTLEAKNLSGSDLRSYFINVIPPHITVNSFTVWVRDTGSTATASTGSLSNTAATASDDSAPSLASGSASTALISTQDSPAIQTDEPPASSSQTPPEGFPLRHVELVPDASSDSGYRVEFDLSDRELDKGEQIILEWDVEGVETVTIAPFTETLPNKGRQPFFPQESMNFTMTARSGELEQLYMLPVKVFDGEPPKAPTIDFFNASPMQMVGAGEVEFSWSVSGEWTRVQLSSADEVVADYLNPQGFRKATVDESATYILTAWNGDLSTAKPVQITVDPSKIATPLAIAGIYPEITQALTNQSITVTVSFTNLPTGKPKPTGTITVTDGSSSCTITLPASSCVLTFKTPGDKKITASYTGDDIYLQSDAPAYGTTIKVQGPEVELVPRYYRNDTGEDITNIADANLGLDLSRGLHVVVEVRPKTVGIPDDSQSHVNVSICDQDANEEPVEGTCQFIGGAVVRAATDTAFGKTVGLFYADIVIPRFLKAGTRALVFDYVHDSNAINPTQLVQPNVKINKVKIHLALSICENPDDLASNPGVCKLGATDPTQAQITFDLRTENPNADLESTLPTIPVSAFTVSSSSAAGTLDWTSCAIRVISGDYKLVCGPLDLNPASNPFTVTIRFDNAVSDSYYIGADDGQVKSFSFNLTMLQSTKITARPFTGIKVGQAIQLTGGSDPYLKVETISGVPFPDSAGVMILTDTSGSAGNFNVASGGANCSIISDGVMKIADTNADCFIYFTKAGSITFEAEYLGDGDDTASPPQEDTTYLGSSASVTAAVAKQNGITAQWNYRLSASGDYSEWTSGVLTQITVGQQLFVRVVLDGPATSFSKGVLVGRSMIARIKQGTAYCMIQAPGTGTAGEYLVTIASNTAATPAQVVADFVVMCNQKDIDLRIELDFSASASDQAGNDFAFTPSLPSKDLRVAQNSNITLTVTAERKATGGNLSVVNASQLGHPDGKFHVGETYVFRFTVGELWSYYYNYSGTDVGLDLVQSYLANNNWIELNLPPVYKNNIDWSKSTCGSEATPRVFLTGYEIIDSYRYSFDFWSWGWDVFNLTTSECTLVFNATVSETPNITFSFTSHNSVYTASETFSTGGVGKQAVSMAFSPASSTASPLTSLVNQSMSVTVTLSSTDDAGTDLKPILSSVPAANQISASVNSGCGSVSEITVTEPNQATIIFSSPAACASGTLTVTYQGNSNFNLLSGQTYPFKVDLHESAAQLEFYNGSAWTTTLPTSYTTGTSYNVRVRVTDNDGHTSLVPTGTVRLKVNGPAATVSGTGVSGPDSNSFYTVALNASGYGQFTLNFSAAGSATITSGYGGSSVFKSTNDVTSGAIPVSAPSGSG